MSGPPRIALLWHRAEDETKARRARLDGVFRALDGLGAAPEPVVYSDDVAEATRERLLRSDGVLAWVNPITDGRDHTVLDSVLREVAAAGVWVSAHPDVVSQLGTKEVLHRTRSLGWGSDVRLYDDVAALRSALPSRLRSGPLVLKRARGNGGLGVWRVELAGAGEPPGLTSAVRVQDAHDGATEDVALATFIERFAAYLAGGGRLVEQPFLPRVGEGMVRCYLSGPTVAGFAEHIPRGFTAADAGADGATTSGFEKTMYGPGAAAFRVLRATIESEWVPGMLRLLGLDATALPAIWDADFLRGPRTAAGADPWVLCEINASCVSPFPEEAAGAIAQTACARVLARRERAAPLV